MNNDGGAYIVALTPATITSLRRHNAGTISVTLRAHFAIAHRQTVRLTICNMHYGVSRDTWRNNILIRA